MGEGGAYLLASLIGTGMQMKAADDADDRRTKVLARAGEEQQKLTDKAINVSKDTAQKYNATDRLAAADAAEQGAASSLGEALTKAGAQDAGAPQLQGKVSNEYVTGRAKATSDTLSRSANLAKLMAKIRAPLDLRFNEGLDNADAATRIAGITGDARNAINAGGIDASGVSPDGAMMLGGAALQGYGAGKFAGSQKGGSGTVKTGKQLGLTDSPNYYLNSRSPYS